MEIENYYLYYRSKIKKNIKIPILRQLFLFEQDIDGDDGASSMSGWLFHPNLLSC